MEKNYYTYSLPVQTVFSGSNTDLNIPAFVRSSHSSMTFLCHQPGTTLALETNPASVHNLYSTYYVFHSNLDIRLTDCI